MVSAATLLKKFANVNNSIIDSWEFVEDSSSITTLKVHLHPYKSHSCRCPKCSQKCKIYDSRSTDRCWRAVDCGGIIVELYYSIKRVYCPEHGVITESVPWAFPDSRFTKDFDMIATFLAMNINKSVASEYMRCDWHTIIRCISRAREYLEPNIKNRHNNLINIGIDETSYRKGHNYLTVVVNQDTNTVVWCAPGHSKEVLSKFFKELTQEQRDSIKTVSGDGARWIDACVNEYIPNATRCIDPFHVVSWANESVDKVRKESWREAHKTVVELSEDLKRKRGRPKKDDKESTKLNKAEEVAKEIKTSLYTLGKNPENLTENQLNKLELIAKSNPRLFRAYLLKERLRLLLKLKDPKEVEAELKKFHWLATHSRISVFKELAYKIRRHLKHILNTIKYQLNSAKVESINNKIKLFIRKGYGFRNIQNLMDIILLGCSNIEIPLPNRGNKGMRVA